MIQKATFWQELKNRWKRPSPKFFNKLKRWGAWFSATSTMVATVTLAVPGFPDLIPMIAAGFALFGVGLTAASSLPVSDTEEVDKVDV